MVLEGILSLRDLVLRESVLGEILSLYTKSLFSVGQKGKKLGHRRVRGDGEITYKKFETTQLMGSIQLGLGQSIGNLSQKPDDRDLLMKDFLPIVTVAFTKDGALQKTPAHNYSEFK